MNIRKLLIFIDLRQSSSREHGCVSQLVQNQDVTSSRKAHFVILFSAFNEVFFRENPEICKTTVTVFAMKKKFIPVLVSLLFVTTLSGTPGTYILSIQAENGFETGTYFLIS